jgi:hypothetical protein
VLGAGVIAPAASLASIAFGVVGGLLAWPRWGWSIGAGAGSLAIMLGTLTWIHWRMRAPRWGVLRHALSAWKVAMILRDGARDLESGRAVRWGGRQYVLESRETRKARQAALAASGEAAGPRAAGR